MKGFNGALMRYLGAKEHMATVIATEDVAPTMRRLRFHSDTAFTEIRQTPGSYLRCWFPDAEGKEHQRAYTCINMDPEHGDFDMDFLLHDPAGPASTWARNAEVGDELAVTPFGVRYFEVPDPPPPGYLLICDAAGIPCVNSLIEDIDDSITIDCYVGIWHADDADIPLASHPRLSVHRVPIQDANSLASAIQPRDYTNWRAYAIPESGVLKVVRRTLSDTYGFPRSHLTAMAYWKAGKNMGVSRDLPEHTEVTVAENTPNPTPDATPDATPAVAPGTVVTAAVAESASAPTVTGSDAAAADRSSVAASPAPSPDKPAKRTWASTRGGQLLRPVRPAMVIAGLVQAAITVLEIAPFVLLTEVARRLLGGTTLSGILPLLWWFLVVMGVAAGLGVILTTAMHLVDARFSAHLRLRMIEHISRLPLGWLRSRGRAGVRRSFTEDVSALHALVTHAIPDAVGAIFAPLLVLVYLFIVDWRVALVMLVPVLVHLFLMYTMVFRSFDAVTEAPRRAEMLRAQAIAYVEAQPILAVFPAMGTRYLRELASYCRFLVGWQKPFAELKTRMVLVSQPSTYLLVIMIAATPLILTGRMSAATVLPFVFLGTTFATKLLAIGYQLQDLKTGIAAANSIGEVLAEPPLTVADPPTPPAAHSGAGVSVEAQHVSFAYEREHEVIHDVNVTIPAGSTCALVGASGAGKSTLAALIARLYEHDGRILIGGVATADMSPDDLYSQVGFVFQDVDIVHGTVADNIALARPEASRGEIERAAHNAHIHARISRLPQGYDTQLRGQGMLSGGELQRIAIARLLLANPPVLVLDEATAYADPATATQVMAALDILREGRTVITIAHRLASLTSADNILVMDDGRIVEHGTHEQLLRQGGVYSRLWFATRSEEPKEDPSCCGR